jgi:hypothetical protein
MSTTYKPYTSLVFTWMLKPAHARNAMYEDIEADEFG